MVGWPQFQVVVLLSLPAAEPPTVLTTAHAVRELPPEQARLKRPVKLSATVTLANGVAKDLFVQDATAGVYVTPSPLTGGLAAGDKVEVEGFTDPGTFAPCVVPRKITKIGHGPLPDPEPFNLNPDDNLWLDAQYVQGWVHVQSIVASGGYVVLRVATAKGVGEVYLPNTPANKSAVVQFLGSVVRVRGVCTSPRHDPATRIALPVARIFVASLAHVEPAPPGIEKVTPVPIIRTVRGFVAGPAPHARAVAIAGVVTHTFEKDRVQWLAVQDETGAARVRLAVPLAVGVGDPVEVTGFLDRQVPGIVLINASARRAAQRRALPEPRATTADQVVRGEQWGALVRTAGIVDEASHREGEFQLKCSDGPNRFLAILVAAEPPEDLASLEPGSRVFLIGVSSPLHDAPGDAPAGFRLHLRSVADVTVAERPTPPAAPVPPSWWTEERLRTLFFAVGGVSLVVAAWVALMRRQIRKQTAEIRAHFEREAALERSLQEGRRLEAMGRLVGGISHDFNNLLTVIINGGDLAIAELSGKHPAAEWVESIRLAAKRAAELTRQLLTFVREKPATRAVLDLNTALAEAEKLLRRTVGEHIQVLTEHAERLPPVLADPALITQIVLNLATNARDAMPHGGELLIRTISVEADGRRLARLVVADTGCGMDEKTRDRIFEPFFTTKEFGKGTGLGLASVYGIVRDLGGTIRVQSTLHQGTTFTIDLPAADTTAPALPAADPEPPPATASSILLVDDDTGVRDMCAAALRRYGFHVVTAGSPQEAIDLVRMASGAFAVLVTDAMMPGMSGAELAATIRAAYPEIRVLVMSGYPREEIPQAGLLLPTDVFLQKPFTPVHLTGQVQAILGGA